MGNEVTPGRTGLRGLINRPETVLGWDNGAFIGRGRRVIGNCGHGRPFLTGTDDLKSGLANRILQRPLAGGVWRQAIFCSGGRADISGGWLGLLQTLFLRSHRCGAMGHACGWRNKEKSGGTENRLLVLAALAMAEHS